MFCTQCGHEMGDASFCGNCGAARTGQAAVAQQQTSRARDPRTIPFYTTEIIPGRTYTVLGLAQGSVVQAKNMGRDFLAGFKNLVGGEIKDYTDMLNEARHIALERMQMHAAQMGADAIVSMRFASAAIMQGAAEMLAYGTAVRLNEEEK